MCVFYVLEENVLSLSQVCNWSPGVVLGFAPAGSRLIKTIQSYLQLLVRFWSQEEAGDVCGAAEQRGGGEKRSGGVQVTLQRSHHWWMNSDALKPFLFRSAASNQRWWDRTNWIKKKKTFQQHYHYKYLGNVHKSTLLIYLWQFFTSILGFLTILRSYSNSS